MGEWDAPHLDDIDAQLMEMIDVSNIACGGHAGSESIIRKTIKLAKTQNVKVGAHPSYIDREHFGRQYISTSPEELRVILNNQIDLFLRICKEEDVKPYHVKPHGALYHACNFRKIESEVLVDLMKSEYIDLILFVYPNSRLEGKARLSGLKTMKESFIDRRYESDLTLMPRSKSKKALITNTEEANAQYNRLSTGEVVVPSGEYMALDSETACIHGDNPNALSILKMIKGNG